MGSTGPKISSARIGLSGRTPVSTVGGTRRLSGSIRPPMTRRAPPATVSAMARSSRRQASAFTMRASDGLFARACSSWP